jgi:hypothetical protein
MVEINITAYADELLLRLDNLPKNIRENLREKFKFIFSQVEQELFAKTPGQYLDRQYIRSGVTDIGDSTIGYIEADDKPGVYSILPNKGRLLRFVSASGDKVHARAVLRHPYLQATPLVARLMEESKPWIIEALEDAVEEALRV